jgi:hypothetical protein
VDAITGCTSVTASADTVDALLPKSTAVLARIRRTIQWVASSKTAAARWSPDPALEPRPDTRSSDIPDHWGTKGCDPPREQEMPNLP